MTAFLGVITNAFLIPNLLTIVLISNHRTDYNTFIYKISNAIQNFRKIWQNKYTGVYNTPKISNMSKIDSTAILLIFRDYLNLP